MSESDTEQREVPAFERWIVAHPEAGFALTMVTVEAYLLFQTLPGLLDPKTRWAYVIFMAPMNGAVVALTVMMVKLQRAVRRSSEVHAAREKLEQENKYREAHEAILEARRRALEQGMPAIIAQQGEVDVEVVPHASEDCPGPGYFPAPVTEDCDGDGPWTCPICRQRWAPWEGTWVAP